MSLRVLHVVGGYPTPEQPHFQPFIKTQVESLREIGVECNVLVLEGRGPVKYATGRPQVRRALREGAYDLIHAHYAYCAVPSFGHGLPVVTSFLGSDLYGRPQADGSFSPWRKRLHHALCRWCIGRSAVSIVKARRMKDDLARDVEIIPNGVDCERFRPLAADARARLRGELGFAADTRYVIFGADPARKRKRFDLARAAVAEAAAAAPFPLHLLAVHGKDQETVIRHLQAGDALVLTSSLEGSPNIVKEAMAANTRVVSVDVGDTRERLEGVSGCRVIASDDPAEIGAALADVLASDEPVESREAVLPLEIGRVAERIRDLYATAIR